MTPIEFVVLGIPEPKGSTRSFRAGNRTVTTSDNPRLKVTITVLR